MAFDVNFGSCNQDPETCPAVKQVFDHDTFCELMAPFDPSAEEMRRILGNVVTMCVKGNCPGQNPELAQQVLRNVLDDRSS